MKLLIVFMATLTAVSSLTAGVLHVPLCCTKMELCSAHHREEAAKPSCHDDGAGVQIGMDHKNRCDRSCDETKQSKNMIDPALLPAKVEIQFSFVEENLTVDYPSDFPHPSLTVPEQPPRT